MKIHFTESLKTIGAFLWMCWQIIKFITDLTLFLVQGICSLILGGVGLVVMFWFTLVFLIIILGALR